MRPHPWPQPHPALIRRWSTRSTSGFGPPRSAPTRIRPGSSGIATCATAGRSTVCGSSRMRRLPLQRAGRQRRLPGSAVFPVVHELRQGEASVEWNQIPLFYSDSTRTLYDQATPGLLTLSDSVQTGIQNKTLSLADALSDGLRSPHASRRGVTGRGRKSGTNLRVLAQKATRAETGGWLIRLDFEAG
jgi:hypothetical protein